MTITLNGTTGITNDGGYTGDGIVFADTTPANTLVTTTGGNVGIGTSSPAYKLDVTGQGRATTGWAVSADGSAFTPSGLNAIPNYGVGYITSTSQTALSGFGGIPFYTNQLERMRITSAGNVGIGTSSPASRLHTRQDQDGVTRAIVQNRNGSGTPLSEVAFITGGFDLSDNRYAYIQSGGGSSTYLAFGTGNGAAPTERARIDSSGNLLVGTTSGFFNSKISVTANSSGGGLAINGMSGSGEAINIAPTGNVNYTALRFLNNGGASVVGTIACSTTETAYNTSSDYRLKNTVAPMTGALARIAALKPVTYKWNADGSDGEGFIAHELAEVVPGCVTGEKDAVNEDGSIKPQGIDTSFLVATLTAAIQEQQAIITALTARVTALEGQA